VKIALSKAQLYACLLTTHEVAWYIILVVSVCMYVCQTITFKSLDVRSSYLHTWHTSTAYLYGKRVEFDDGHWVKVKVTGAKKVDNSIPVM